MYSNFINSKNLKLYTIFGEERSSTQVMPRRRIRFSNTFSSYLKTVSLNVFPIMEGYKLRCFMFNFHVDPDLYILFEKLAA